MLSKDKQRQGITKAKARGVYKGRKRGATKKHPSLVNLPRQAIKMSAAGMTYKEIASELGVSINTVSRYVRKKEIEVPSRTMLEDLGIESGGGTLNALCSVHAIRALLEIYRIASSYPEAVRQLLEKIGNGPRRQFAMRHLLSVTLNGPDFGLLRGKTKLPPRPSRALKGVSEEDMFRIVRWASETPDLAKDVIERTHQTNGVKIELLLRFAEMGTRRLDDERWHSS